MNRLQSEGPFTCRDVSPALLWRHALAIFRLSPEKVAAQSTFNRLYRVFLDAPYDQAIREKVGVHVRTCRRCLTYAQDYQLEIGGAIAKKVEQQIAEN